MKNENDDDNLYKEGTIICAKVDPTLKLIVRKYRQRIYYCAVADHPEQNNLAYFEKELMPPTQDQQVQFIRVADNANVEKNFLLNPKFSFANS